MFETMNGLESIFTFLFKRWKLIGDITYTYDEENKLYCFEGYVRNLSRRKKTICKFIMTWEYGGAMAVTTKEIGEN